MRLLRFGLLVISAAACSGQPSIGSASFAAEAGTPPPPSYSRNQLDAVTSSMPPIVVSGTVADCPVGAPCFIAPSNMPSGDVDSYARDVYERPAGAASTAATYFPSIDIASADTGVGAAWVFYRLNLVGPETGQFPGAPGSLPHFYRVEVNYDADPQGDAIIELDAPSSTLGNTWSNALIIRTDANASMGGPRALVADGPGQAGGGYEQLVFDNGTNLAPGAEGGTTAVQARVTGNSIEVAVFRPFLESLTSSPVTGAAFRPYAARAAIAASSLYAHDNRSRGGVGSPYPWLQTAGAPTTCPNGPNGDNGLTAAELASLESGTRLDTGILNPCYAGGSIYEFDNAGTLAALASKSAVTFDVDLTLVKTDTPDPATVGQPLTYILTVTNVTTGAGGAHNPIVTDTLPASVTFVAASPGCTHTAGVVTCVIGTLANGASTAVAITVLPTVPGSISNTATVTSDGDELTPANNTDTEGTTVLSANPMCGDGNVDPGEACDDGNQTPNDGCENDCTLSIICGNGVVQGTEACDDGNQTPNDGCENDCTISIACGNGIVQGTEICDDGNQTPNDGCENTCRLSLGEDCDDDAQCASNTCDEQGSGTCEPANRCGNGHLESGETCDDGNTTNNDGCSSTCVAETDTDGDGVGDPVDLDDDNDGLPDLVELDADSDGDGTLDRVDLDSDNDGVSDANEAGHQRADTNGDFMIDCAVGFRPTGYCLALRPYTLANTDGDGVLDYLDLDSDNDGLSDLVEGGSGCTDVSDDGICDRGVDTDHDGIADSADHHDGFGNYGAVSPANTDGDDQPDFRDLDSDGDTRWDIAESKNAALDATNDGVLDGALDGVRDARVDSDHDSLPDFQDPDDDNDGLAGEDNCPLDFNADQADIDGDGIGDACDDKDDRWGVAGGGCRSTPDGSIVFGVALLFLLLPRRRLHLAVLVALAIPVASHAQAVEGELGVERFQLASDRDGILDVESGRVRRHLEFDLGLWLGYANDPLTVYRPTTDGPERAGSLVKNQVGGEFTGVVGLLGHFQLGAAVPLVLSQTDDLDGSMFTTPGSSFAVGDIRAIVKLQLLHQQKHGIDAGIITSITFPTASGDGFTGNEGLTAAPALVISRAWQTGVRAALEGGYRAREQLMLGGTEVDDELFAGIGAAYDLGATAGPPLTLELAFAYATPADDAFGAFDRNYAEIKPGVAIDFGLVSAFVAGGVGVTEGFGTPDWRILAGIRISRAREAPVPPPAHDTDKDGFVDTADRCVLDPEDVDQFEDTDGCPDLDDDKDGIADAIDKCPREPEDKDGFDESDGCPDLDNDRDGILDAADRCPGVAEDKDGFEDDNGCPDFDNDRDGVLDGADTCPLVAGAPNGNGCPLPDKDGDGVLDRLDNCPDWAGKPAFHGCNGPQLVKLTDTKLELLEPVAFAKNRATITPTSLRVLDAVALVLKNHVELRIGIEAASTARAQAVQKYLVKKGVAADRLSAKAGKTAQVDLTIAR